MTIRDRIIGLERMRAGDFVPHPENWRKHPERQRSVLRDMLAEVGIADAVIARRLDDGRLMLLDGHLRADLDPDLILPVLVLDVDEDEGRKLLASLDPLAAMADTAHDKLRTLVAGIEPGTPGLRSLLERLAGEGEGERPDLDDAPLPPVKPKTKPGDLWLLGAHRVLCGSATDDAALTALMAGEQAAVVFTDPPYGVSYEAPSGQHDIIKGDQLRRDDLLRLLRDALKLAAKHTTDEAAFYVWHASATREDFADALKAAGLEERQYLIWAKPGFVFGRADYQWAHEPCFYAAKAGQTPAWRGRRDQSTVWRVASTGAGDRAVALGPGLIVTDGEGGELYLSKPPKRRARHIRLADSETVHVVGDADTTVWEVGRDQAVGHPTQKPVELARRAIENSSQPGEGVLDVFLGSGTTLIGAHVTDRRAFGIDLDPKYVDVTCARWQRLTGKHPILERTGEPHDFLTKNLGGGGHNRMRPHLARPKQTRRTR